ncbi:alkaline-phosphatase-like protein [Helicostylum pulchrum]|nr:alkaline-phosphatase-like protein [Helicostylum pulchrum]
MSRSRSDASRSTDQHGEYNSEEEQVNLLNKEEQSDSEEEEGLGEDEEWAIIVDENEVDVVHDFEKDNPTLRYACIALAIGLLFIIFKVAMVRFTHESGHTERGAERLYYNGSEYFASTVILISFDGFRPDYLNRGVTPNLKQFANDGIMASYMHPAFPPSTFPNHWTLVTGLYPEAHGIVANLFYDPDIDSVFSHSNSTSTADRRWWKGEPIWTTSRINGRRTGSIMWPGSETNYNPPDMVVKYNGTMSTKEKMETTLSWLDLPYDSRPQVITIYCPQIDQEGHRTGPHDAKMNKYIEEADTSIGYLLSELKERNLDSHAHVVIVSDHGMADVTDKKLIFYDDILSPEVLKHVGDREALPLLDLRPSPGAPKDTVQKIYDQLYNYTQTVKEPRFQVYLREDVPDRFHYKHSNRITPVVAIPDVGYSFVTHAQVDEKGFQKGGNHGYDNLAVDMRAIFMAKGPKIDRVYKQGTVLAPFFNTEVYGLLTELLNMDAPPNNGTLHADFPISFSPPF